MMTVNRLTCLWPGLARLWFRGEWRGLSAACAFAALLNGVIAATLLWPEVAPASIRIAGIVVVGCWWLIAAIWSLRDFPEIASQVGDDPYQGLFVAAQTEYLKGNWIEAEANLRKLLRRRPRDVQSQLLLATMQRRTHRVDEARQQLQQLARLDAARPWQTEIRNEREMLRQASQWRRLEQIEIAAHTGAAAQTDEISERVSNEPTSFEDKLADAPTKIDPATDNNQQQRAA